MLQTRLIGTVKYNHQQRCGVEFTAQSSDIGYISWGLCCPRILLLWVLTPLCKW